MQTPNARMLTRRTRQTRGMSSEDTRPSTPLCMALRSERRQHEVLDGMAQTELDINVEMGALLEGLGTTEQRDDARAHIHREQIVGSVYSVGGNCARTVRRR